MLTRFAMWFCNYKITQVGILNDYKLIYQLHYFKLGNDPANALRMRMHGKRTTMGNNNVRINRDIRHVYQTGMNN